jgi:hypothetical protein
LGDQFAPFVLQVRKIAPSLFSGKLGSISKTLPLLALDDHIDALRVRHD